VDPFQRTNLVHKTDYSALQSRLDELLKQKLAQQKDDFRRGPDYVRDWGYNVDQNETAPFLP
jgi:hypothetical protein